MLAKTFGLGQLFPKFNAESNEGLHAWVSVAQSRHLNPSGQVRSGPVWGVGPQKWRIGCFATLLYQECGETAGNSECSETVKIWECSVLAKYKETGNVAK